MRDLDTSKSLDLLIKAGVDTLKIEGRKKDAQYVASAVKLYRQNLNRLFGRETLRKNAPQAAFSYIHDDKPVETDLEFSFKRNPTSFFLKSRYQENVIDLNNPTHKGVEAGTILSTDGSKVTFRTKLPIQLYDGLRIALNEKVFHAKPQDGEQVQTSVNQTNERYENKHIEFSVRELHVSGQRRTSVAAGAVVTVTLPENSKSTSKGATIYKVRSADLRERIEKITQKPEDTRLLSYESVRLALHVDQVSEGLSVSVKASHGSFDFEIGPFALPTAQRPHKDSRFAADLQAIFRIFGDVELSVSTLNLTGDLNWFAPKSMLKSLKQDIGFQLKQKIHALRDNRREQAARDFGLPVESLQPLAKQSATFSVKVDRIETAQAVLEHAHVNSIKELIFEPKRAFIGTQQVKEAIEGLFQLCSSKNVVLRWAVPTVVRAWDEPLLAAWTQAAYTCGVRHFEIGNIGGKALVERWTDATDLNLSSDFTLYALNAESRRSLEQLGIDTLTLSIEDDLENVRSHCQSISKDQLNKTAVILYKDTPLFIAEACSLTALHNGCPTSAVCGYRTLEIENQSGDRFFVAHESCKSVVYGKTAFSVAQLKDSFEALGINHFRVDFLTRPYDLETVTRIVNSCIEGRRIEDTHTANFNRTLL